MPLRASLISGATIRVALRWILSRRQARHLAALLFLLLLVSAQTTIAGTNAVPATNARSTRSTVDLSSPKPRECAVKLTSILTGSGTFSATAQNQLVLGSQGGDTVALQKNDCFVGGGPASGTQDRVTGPTPGG